MDVTGTVTPTPTPTLPHLTATDRCDRCGAQARVRVLLSSGELMFCGHHGKAYAEPLKDKALQWLDEGTLDAPV